MTRERWDHMKKLQYLKIRNDPRCRDRAEGLSYKWAVATFGERPKETGGTTGAGKPPWYLRLAVKIAGAIGGRMLKKLPGKLKSWLPVIAVLILAGKNVALTLGLDWLAAALDTFGGLIGAGDLVQPGVGEAVVSVIAALGAAYKAVKLLWRDVIQPLFSPKKEE